MNRFPVSRALIVILLILALSACANISAAPEATTAPGPEDAAAAVDAPESAPSLPPNQSQPPAALSSFDENTFVDLYKQVNQAVVNIRVSAAVEVAGDETPQVPQMPDLPGVPLPEFPDLQPMPRQGQGSGFIYDKEGHIVTNNHVVAGADDITVVFADGTEVDATLVGADPDTDLAVVRVDDIDGDLLVPLRLGDSDALQVGQFVVAIGNPFGLSGSMSTGIISGLGRVLPASASQFSIPDIIQTDAAVNPGNSGGPLLDLDGQVIGVNTAIASPSRAFAGVGYAVPSDTVGEVVPELIANGRVQHPWLGISGRTLDRETAEAMELDPSQRGILVVDVIDESPAEASGLLGSDTQASINGLQVRVGGDIITGIDDQEVNDFDDLLSYLSRRTRVDQVVTLEIVRDGEVIHVEVTLAPRPENGQ